MKCGLEREIMFLWRGREDSKLPLPRMYVHIYLLEVVLQLFCTFSDAGKFLHAYYSHVVLHIPRYF